MSRVIHADVVTELAKNSFTMAHLLKLDFATPVYLTDAPHDIVHGGITYDAGGHLIGLGAITESSDIKLSSLNLTLSGVNQTYISILLNQAYVDKQVVINRIFLNASATIIGNPVMIYEGRMQAFSIKDDKNSSTISLTAASHWADFNKVAGRTTNEESQRAAGFNGSGFRFAAKLIKDIKWGRA
tara:strand:- start:2841 stop:3395 length:555 start_codon:yes stop_codon:yes gene_type:complete